MTTASGSPNTFDEIANIYKHEKVSLWPLAKGSAEINPALDALHKIMSPPGCTGSIHGAWDDLSIIYSIENTLILLSWDPALHLRGVERYPGSPNGEIPGAMAALPWNGNKDAESDSRHLIPDPEPPSSIAGSKQW